MNATPSARCLDRLFLTLFIAFAAFPLHDRLSAQQPIFPTPRLTSLVPAGGRIGTKVEVTVHGLDLDDATELYFSNPDIKARRLPDPTPKTEKKKEGKKPPAATPPIRFEITIPTDISIGLHDVRVIGKWGVSNPRAFEVGALAEFAEKEKNNDVPDAQAVEINSVINGVIGDKVDVDFFSFEGKKGQKIVLRCASSSIDSRLLAYLQLFNEAGKELASNKNYRDHDAVLGFTLPEDGRYLIRLCEFAYQFGGPEHFYRLTLTDGPWIDAVYPAIMEPGKDAAVHVLGKNLPGGVVDPNLKGFERIEAKVSPIASTDELSRFPGRLMPRLGTVDGFAYRIKSGTGQSNPAFLAIASSPLTLDNKKNDTTDSAQEILLPCTLCGRIEKRGDRDYYVFAAKKGETYFIETLGDRLRAPINVYFHLRHIEKDQMLGVFDDHPEIPASVERFFTHTDDAQTKFVVPEDGHYELMVRSQTADFHGGPRLVYGVDVRKPKPDFRLVVVGNHENGAGLTLRRGGSQDIRIVCFRQDDFDDEIVVEVDGLPPGISCPPQVIGPRVKEAVLVLSASRDAKDWTGEIKIKGTALVNGKEVVRDARAGCLVYPTANNNQPALSRLCRSICMAVRDKGPFHLDTDQKDIALPVGSPASFKIKVVKDIPDFKDNVQIIAASGPVQPNGKVINFPKLTVGPDKEGEMKVTIPANTPPGTYNLVFRGSGKLNWVDEKKKKTNVNFTSVTAPIRVTVFDSIARLKVAERVVLKPGSVQALPVSVERLHGYKGELKLELVAPKGGNGISAADITLPAGATDAKLAVKVAKEAKPGMTVAFLIRATAKFEKVTLKEEAKLQITVSKDAAGTETPTDFKTIKLLAEGAPEWKFTRAEGVKGASWREEKYDDSKWRTVKAPLGNGEEEIKKRGGTELAEKGVSILCRHELQIAPELLKEGNVQFLLQVASDNSATVYINGKLVDDDRADHEFSYWNREVPIPVSLLQAGRNVIAVEVHNTSGSSDLYFDGSILAQVPVRK